MFLDGLSYIVHLCSQRVFIPNSLNILLFFITGVPCCLCLHSNGKFPQAWSMGAGKISRLWKNLHTMAVFLWFLGRLRDAFWSWKSTTHQQRRLRCLYHWILQHPPIGGWGGKPFLQIFEKINNLQNSVKNNFNHISIFNNFESIKYDG